MADRFSGQVRVSIRYQDCDWRPNGEYRCVVSWPGGREVVIVGTPGIITCAVDSPEAFDDAARAAIGFLDDAFGAECEFAEYETVVEGPCSHDRLRIQRGRLKARATGSGWAA